MKPGLDADRLVYFSDAVVAIAITLLVLPLVDLVPEARREPVAELLSVNYGPIFAFGLSFAVIARLWMVHHAAFDGIERVGHAVVLVDMVWLLTIVVLPFAAALTGDKGDDPLTPQIYVGVLAVNLLSMTVLSVLTHRERGDDADETSARRIDGAGGSASMAVIAFVVVLVAPALSFYPLLLLFVSPLGDRVVRAVRRRVWPQAGDTS